MINQLGGLELFSTATNPQNLGSSSAFLHTQTGSQFERQKHLMESGSASITASATEEQELPLRPGDEKVHRKRRTRVYASGDYNCAVCGQRALGYAYSYEYACLCSCSCGHWAGRSLSARIQMGFLDNRSRMDGATPLTTLALTF